MCTCALHTKLSLCSHDIVLRSLVNRTQTTQYYHRAHFFLHMNQYALFATQQINTNFCMTNCDEVCKNTQPKYQRKMLHLLLWAAVNNGIKCTFRTTNSERRAHTWLRGMHSFARSFQFVWFCAHMSLGWLHLCWFGVFLHFGFVSLFDSFFGCSWKMAVLRCKILSSQVHPIFFASIIFHFT